jgi:hypothetical protein
LSLYLLPLYLLTYDYGATAVTLALGLLGTWFLKKNWYDKLEP